MAGKKKIFITGASSELMRKFIALIDTDQFALYCLTRTVQGKRDTDAVHWVAGNLSSVEQFSDYLRDCSMVVHAAAVTHAYDERAYYDVNTHATCRLIEVARTAGVKNFVFISSRAAGYDSGAYGRSKILAEECVMRGIDRWIIFRLSELYGGRNSRAIDNVVGRAMASRVMFCPAGMPSKLYPMHVDDAARLILARSFDDACLREIVTLNGKEGYSYREIIQETSRLCAKKTWIIPLPRWLMYGIYRVAKWLPVNSGFVPDQIPRLYSRKVNQDPGYDLQSFGEHIRRLVQKNNRCA